jgi:glutaredoxin
MWSAFLACFRQWFGRRPVPLQDMHFLLYTRRGCHLCEVARERLRRAGRRYRFALEVVDIDTDPALAARYGDQVPVVLVNAKVRFRGGVNEVLLARLLHAEGAKRRKA